MATSAAKYGNNATVGYLWLLQNKSFSAGLAVAIPYNNSILTAHFNANPATTVTVNYVPTEGDNDATDHYE